MAKRTIKKASSDQKHLTVADGNRLVGAYEELLRVDSMTRVLEDALSANDDLVHYQFQLQAMRSMVMAAARALDATGFNSVRGIVEAPAA